jgi:hypothetical protein
LDNSRFAPILDERLLNVHLDLIRLRLFNVHDLGIPNLGLRLLDINPYILGRRGTVALEATET